MQVFRYRNILARGICGFNLGAVVGTGALVIVFQEITWSWKTSETWASKSLWPWFSKALPAVISGPCKKRYLYEQVYMIF